MSSVSSTLVASGSPFALGAPLPSNTAFDVAGVAGNGDIAIATSSGQEPSGGPSSGQLYVQVFDPSGAAQSAPTRLATSSETFAAPPPEAETIVPLAGGGWALAWNQPDSATPEHIVQLGVLGPSGALIESTQLGQSYDGPVISASALGSGGGVFEWTTDTQSNSGNVSVVTFDAAGNVKFPASALSTGIGPIVAVGVGTGAAFVVAYPDGSSDSGAVSYFDGSAFRTPVSLPVDAQAGAGAALTNGDVALVWDLPNLTLGGTATGYTLESQLFDPATDSLLGSPVILGGSPSAVASLRAFATTDGGYLVSWQASQGPGQTTSVRVVDPSGDVGPLAAISGEVAGFAGGALVAISSAASGQLWGQDYAIAPAGGPGGGASGAEGQFLQAQDGGSVLVGGTTDDILIGASGPDTMTGGGGHDRFVFNVLPTTAGQVTDFNPTTDKIDLGYLLETAGYTGSDALADGYVLRSDDGHGGTVLSFVAKPGADLGSIPIADLLRVAPVQITASDIAMGAATPQAAVQMGFDEVLRQASPTPADQTFHDQLISQANAGTLTTSQAASQIVQHAEATTSVATLAYEFFTGQAPTAAGMDYLVSPTGPNPDNLNSAYYQAFNLQNRYINFAVNLGVHGQGAQAFAQAYGSGDIYQATAQAYQTIFGTAPSDAKAHALIDTDVSFGGQTMTRGQYFALYGGDGANGVGTKAAMVGWLLAEAATENVGTYAQSNDAFLTDVALHSAPFGVDIVGHYAQPGFAYTGG